MKTKILKLPIVSVGNEYVDNPEGVTLEITDKTIDLIKKAKKFIADNSPNGYPEIESVNIDFCGESYRKDGEDVSDFDKYSTLRVTQLSILYQSFSKHDSSATIETDDFTNKLKKELA